MEGTVFRLQGRIQQLTSDALTQQETQRQHHLDWLQNELQRVCTTFELPFQPDPLQLSPTGFDSNDYNFVGDKPLEEVAIETVVEPIYEDPHPANDSTERPEEEVEKQISQTSEKTTKKPAKETEKQVLEPRKESTKDHAKEAEKQSPQPTEAPAKEVEKQSSQPKEKPAKEPVKPVEKQVQQPPSSGFEYLLQRRVVDLKAELKKRGLRVTGRKSELVDRLSIALEGEANASEPEPESDASEVPHRLSYCPETPLEIIKEDDKVSPPSKRQREESETMQEEDVSASSPITTLNLSQKFEQAAKRQRLQQDVVPDNSTKPQDDKPRPRRTRARQAAIAATKSIEASAKDAQTTSSSGVVEDGSKSDSNAQTKSSKIQSDRDERRRELEENVRAIHERLASRREKETWTKSVSLPMHRSVASQKREAKTDPGKHKPQEVKERPATSYVPEDKDSSRAPLKDESEKEAQKAYVLWWAEQQANEPLPMSKEPKPKERNVPKVNALKAAEKSRLREEQKQKERMERREAMLRKLEEKQAVEKKKEAEQEKRRQEATRREEQLAAMRKQRLESVRAQVAQKKAEKRKEAIRKTSSTYRYPPNVLPPPEETASALPTAPTVVSKEEESYDMSEKGDSDSDSSANRERRRKKKIPTWARSENVRQALVAQYGKNPSVHLPQAFEEFVGSCNLVEMFEPSDDRKKERLKRRGSSGDWSVFGDKR